MRRLLAVLALGAVAVAAGCSSGGGDSTGRLTAEGQTEVAGAGGDWRPITGSVRLKSDDQARVVDGMAKITLGDDRQVSLRKGTHVKVTKMAGVSAARPSLVAGDLLVEAPHGPLVVNAGDSDIEVSGVARISRGLTVVVGTYSGKSTVTSAGRQLVVPALHQANVPAVGLLPSRPSPLAYAAGDPWDERFLGDAIQLGDELAARSRGFTAQIRPGEEVNGGFYRQLIPALAEQPDFDSTFAVTGRTPGESLVGLAITAEGKNGLFNERLQRVLAFHDEGAAWGIVALDQGVTRVRILALVDQALGRGPTLVAEEPVAPVSRSVSGSSSQSSAASSGAQEPESSPVEASAPTSSPSPALPSAGPLRTGVPVLDGTVNSLVDVLSGLLGALGR